MQAGQKCPVFLLSELGFLGWVGKKVEGKG